jgi:hypothetical protein
MWSTMKPTIVGAPLLWTSVGVLGVAVIAQAVYTARLRNEVDDLSAQLVVARKAEPAKAPTASPRWAPRRVPSSDHAESVRLDEDGKAVQPLVRALVADEFERREWEKEARKSARSEDAYSELGDGLVNHVGVSRADADRVQQILMNAREARQDLRRAERTRELTTQEATESLAELRATTQEQLEEILGDEWIARLEQTREVMREARRQQREARGRGGVFWFMPSERRN